MTTTAFPYQTNSTVPTKNTDTNSNIKKSLNKHPHNGKPK